MRANHTQSYRFLLTLLALLTCSLAQGESIWDGTSKSASLSGEGTRERPYEIASGADLKLLQSDPSLWAAGLYFLQIDDIDLNGNELGIIGYGDGTKTGNDINSSNYKPFFATYDGGGHKIKNLLILWDIKQMAADKRPAWDTSPNFHYSAGLFGLLAGTVRNLHIDNATVTRSADAQKSNNKCDMRLGVIAGALAPNKAGDKEATIENIIISNSLVNDGPDTLYDDPGEAPTDLKTYFFGGVVGDVSCGYGGTNNISLSNYGKVNIRNIYANVDFSLPNTVRTTTDAGSITQFDIGGIVGRMRRGKSSDLPVDVLYKGKVRAPLAAIAPTICMARCNGTNNVNGMNDTYTGEVISSSNTTNTGSFTKLNSDEVKVGSETVYPNENRFFHGYEIWDSAVSEYVTVSGSYPAPDYNRSGIRTLDADGSQLTTNPPSSMMRSWQGVNHGSFINLRTNIGANTATDRLNSLNDPVKFAWDADNETFVFSANEYVTLTRNSLHTLTANIYNDNRTANYIYSWTLTDREGHTHTYEATKTGLSNAHAAIDVSLSTCQLTIKDDFRDYTKVSMTLYDEAGHSLSTAELDLPEFGLTFKRSTETVDAVVRYRFSPEYSFDGEEIPADDPLLAASSLYCAWSAYSWNGTDWEPNHSAIYSGALTPEVVVNHEFVGSVRLVVTDSETGTDYNLTAHTEIIDDVETPLAYMEQRLERMRLSFNMQEIVYDPSTGEETYIDFNPADYFTGSSGYAVGYDYSTTAADNSGIVIIDQQKAQHYLSTDNTRGTLRDTKQKPLIFQATVVDQFGNVQPYDEEKYKVQWTFKIPDSRSERKDYDEHPKAWEDDFNADTKLCTIKERWDYDPVTEYTSVNGQYPNIESAVNGSGLDWVGRYYRQNTANVTPQWACDRWGEYAVVGATTFKIHPNLLHCTSGFDVRAVLYDVTDGSSVETVISFSQVDFNTQALPSGDGYEAIVAWRSGDIPYTSGSPYSFTWYSNPDPTDYDGWTKMEEFSVDYINDGWPSDEVKANRNRRSSISGVDMSLFYKVEFRTSSGTYAEGIMGPENVIFVYDRALTLENPDFHDFDVYDVQSNYYFPQGDDTNHGRDPWHAVATMGQAFKLLDADGSYRTNRIVVMGFYHEYDRKKPSTAQNYFMHTSWWKNVEAKPTTISGAYGSNIKGGTLGLGFEGGSQPFNVYLQKPMRWENMSIFTYNSSTTDHNCVYACNHDFTVGQGVRIINFGPPSVTSGLADGASVPNFTLVAGHFNYMERSKVWDDPIYEMNNEYRLRYDGNEVPGVCSIKIHSGCFSRIIGASRNSDRPVPALYGTPDNPNRSRIEIDIRHEAGREKEFAPDWYVAQPDGTRAATPVQFNCDLGMVVGGQTDGSTFSDTEITIYNGHVSRYVSGSITYGRHITSYPHPDDAYFGRTVLNIHGGTFDEIYGGSLGRAGDSNSNMVKAFFYGRSVINMYGGVIGTASLPTAAKVFAAGAGGVIGKGQMWTVDGRPQNDERKTYTSDDRIPFLTKEGGIEFRAFDEENPDASLPAMQYVDTDGSLVDFDLTDSQVELNLYGGTIYGNVYGGGYGFSNNLYSTNNAYKRAPYRILENAKELQCIAGNLYGTSYVRLLPNPDDSQPDAVITGSVYGGGAGDDRYVEYAKTHGNTVTLDGTDYTLNFTEVAKTFGDVHVEISGGHVMGNVYGGGCGIEKYAEMANIYGNTSLSVEGGIVDGNIYGGAAYSDIRKYTYTAAKSAATGGGDTYVNISGGTVGNCIFGGGEGKVDKLNPANNTASNVAGDTHVEITGGAFSSNPYLGTTGDTPKAFNIYGGGYVNGTVGGDTHVLIRSSLLMKDESIDIDRDFRKAWNDILDRRFCVYGAGYGELTRVDGNTYVDIDIPRTKSTVDPDINDITELIPGQTLFDVAGGGYSGNAGYWVDKDGTPIHELASHTVDSYCDYVGGQLNVTVRGVPFIRKVIGGSFYAECNNTNTYLESGSVKEVYGGALMGYVHDHALLNIGSKAREDAALAGGFDSFVLKDAASAADCNSRLFVTGSVYGGNDVKGIVGTTFWTNDVPGENFGKRGAESTDGAPLFCSYVSQAVNKGVSLLIHGGTIGGNVYGAGNGHYRGYYVPDWVRYNDGPDRHYRVVRLIKNDPSDPDKYGKVYRCRPMTGSVTMHVGGNSETDRVSIRGNLYGGGRSCTIGQWNTILPYEDPRRLVKAGFLHVNFGSHVDVTSVYMGAQGDDFMRPKELTTIGVTVGDGEIPETMDLDDVGEIAYDHWYLNEGGTKYMPGFPPPGEVDGNYGMLGAHMLRGYAKNIEMNADIELTFYANPFRLHADNTPEMSPDGTAVLCKKWVPAERAHTAYDASDVTFTNFFGGGASGFMTNNKLMRYNYTTEEPVPDITYNYYNDARGFGVDYDYHASSGDQIETFGTIYRYSLPPGLKVLDKVVGGSEDAIESTRGYEVNADETITFNGDVLYTFEGGMVTQCSYTYDLIVHNDLHYEGYHKNLDHAIPAEHFAHRGYGDSYTIQNGPDAGLTIHRWHIPEKTINPNSGDITDSRYDLAYYYDDAYPGKKLAYCGPRESRIEGNRTVLKLTVACQFDPQEGDSPALDPGAGEHEKHFGGVIYGGCYNSGVTQGDVMVTVSSNTIGDHQDVSDPEAFGQISSLAHNVGRVFGGGYGPDSRVDGNTYVNLLRDFVGMNVFGGGCRGNVNGTTHVKYLGDETNSFILGSIYGGSLYGRVGVEGVTPVATDVRLFSGNVDKVYGGSCLGDLYGRTNVELCDEVTTELEYFDYNSLLDNDDIDDWGGSRLIVGSVFGGNDIAGLITPQPASTDPENPAYVEKDQYATYICTYEVAPEPSPDPHSDDSGSAGSGPGKKTPGSNGDYNGYPLIGYLYAGSNGNYGTQGVNAEGKSVYHTDDAEHPVTVTFATGEGNAVMNVNLSGFAGTGPEHIGAYPAFEVPNVSRARLDIEGGTIVNAYGGGDCATITAESLININYKPDTDIMDARAGFVSEDDFVRTWNTCHLSHTDQIEEVTFMLDDGSGGSDRVFRHHIFRLFGGNDKAPMAIQPTWNLYSGHLGSVYSGGNFGAMTYFSRDAEGKPLGLSLKIDSPHFHADAVYGGGRVGNIEPATDDAFAASKALYATDPDDGNEVCGFYGATLDIRQGVIDHVYGGNDVSGNVSYGTRVKISGAISGDVYCAGNGNYLYKYDPDFTGSDIEETFDSKLGRYFRLPLCADYGADDPTGAERILAVNHYRPNVDRSFLSIEGSKQGDDITYAYVRGNVYCGGNSSTVGVGVEDSSQIDGISFDIGKFVMLNGVFLGSNGENLVDPAMMRAFEELNGVNLADATETFPDSHFLTHYTSDFARHDREVVSDNGHFPRLLDIYMRAVDVYSTPADFKMNPANIEESYIGDFFVGGNRGSMLTKETIALTFPHDLVIFGKIVGGSNNANVTYKGVKHIGGLTRASDNPDADRVYLQILSKFEPWKMTYPAKNALGQTDYRYIKVVPDVDKVDGALYFPESKCSVFGGCFNSGRTVGNIHIDLYSDLAGEYSPESEIYRQIEELYQIGTGSSDITKERIIVNGIDNLQRRSFALIGAGFGGETSVLGNIRLHMLPGQFHNSFKDGHNESPSAGTIFAGSEKGDVTGNTEITVRDGVVLSNLYGGSESSTLYGSTNIIIGWPKYFVCSKTGEYSLSRTDNISKGAKFVKDPEDTNPEPVKKKIWLCKGDYMSVNLYRQIDPEASGLTRLAPDATNPYGALVDSKSNQVFKYVGDDTPENYAAHNNSSYVEFHNITWDDINIYIGNNKSRLSSRAEYYAHGNIYGGGFISANSGTTLAGEYTVRKFDEDHTPDPALIGYGGNSTILIWDNPDNAHPENTVGSPAVKSIEGKAITDGTTVRDHITIGTGHYKPVTLRTGQDAMGYYKFVPKPGGRYQLEIDNVMTEGIYVHQSSHILKETDDKLFFEIESDGGIYGGGRKVYVEGFRNCDICGYGYADYTPQYPKLLNTAQRLDLFTITDCCLMMQGAVDFASNSIDATRYSMTRIGELEMRSSIDPSVALEPGVRDDSALANVIHDEHRVRNYMAFFHDVLYVSAMTSSEAFTNSYRGANGQLGYIGNLLADPEALDASHYQPSVDYTPLDFATVPFSYKQYKANRIDNFYANVDKPNTVLEPDGSGGYNEVPNPAKLVTELEFDQRNVGTSANMIGINNGYTLKIQGAIVDAAGNDQVYYGPVNGVFEVKLMTLATDEGGGYIYALNQHDDPNHFLETTGNFVFPGAAYRKTSQKGSAAKRRDAAAEDYNYVYDDCFPMGKGWDYYTSSGAVCDDPEKGGHEVHFWYVNGSNFYFNVTLTAYTYNEPQYFRLNNNEDLIYLYGIGDSSRITLDSAAWPPIDDINTDGYDSDLRNLAAHPKDYQLFLSIDDEPERNHTLGSGTGDLGVAPDPNHAFITRIPRADLATDAAGNPVTDDADFVSTPAVNNYGTFSGNSPLLGITLYDACHNAGKGYYEDHLDKDETVRLVLKATDPSDPNDLTFQYIINLTVKYVKGPAIDGHLQIENDALPGEYIYANAYGVNIDMDDENMGISARNWYLVGRDCDISSNTDIHDYISSLSSGTKKAAEPVLDQFVGDNDLRQIHIPAYLYRDGWNVVYEIKANGLSFYVTPELDPTPEPGTRFYPDLRVHNYHRMKPMVPGAVNPEDLRLTEGAWIYIEDDDDMAYFFDWLAFLQPAAPGDPDCEVPVNGGGVINPHYAKGLTVQLMRDVRMPDAAAAAGLRFDGTFHGNGHNIDMGTNPLFLADNRGSFFNTGFISSLNAGDGAAVFDSNSGTIDCCFFYNENADKGEIIDDANNSGTISNCYTTSELDSRHYTDGLSFAALDDFRYGKVAYELNRFYLQQRYNANAASVTADDLDAVSPIVDKFTNGEYRYGGVRSDDYAFLLRTASVPNYRDYLGLRINATTDQVTSGSVLGTAATMHDIQETPDDSRLIKDAAGDPVLVDGREQYAPQFPADFLFFGQDLTFGSADLFPHAAYTTNRVYRASGFFGSKVDRGFHFNSRIHALRPTLTAVDFSGVRDGAHGNLYTKGRSEFTDARGEVDQKVWYGPQLDLPADLAACTFDTGSRLQEEATGSIPETHVTRNLLVYRQEGSLDDLDRYGYDLDTPFEDVYCHVVDVPADPAARPAAEYLQLVDKEDFNAPVGFDVTGTAWYRRLPAVWADNADGWEGVCIPFTANITYGSVESGEVDSLKNHGLMTHFYGLDESDPDPASSDYWNRQTHEYWLRKFTGIKDGKALFDRPASKPDTDAANPADDIYDHYSYSNEYFVNAFGNLRYYDWNGTDHTPDAYTHRGTVYDSYPMLTAHFPYLVSFPGPRYYEFDCSGEFYSDHTGDPVPDPQIITFAWHSEKARSLGEVAPIEVSDDSMVTFSHDGKSFLGTFMHTPVTDADIVVRVKDNAASLAHPETPAEKVVLPFRAYMSGASKSKTLLRITSSGVDSIGDPDEPGNEPDQNPAEQLIVYLDGRELVVENPFDTELTAPLCDIAGRVLRFLDIAPGKNRYGNLDQGVYLLSSFKFYIP